MYERIPNEQASGDSGKEELPETTLRKKIIFPIPYKG